MQSVRQSVCQSLITHRTNLNQLKIVIDTCYDRLMKSVINFLPVELSLKSIKYSVTEPTGPPQNVHARTISSTSIQVTWSPPLPSEQNGIILRYIVHYRPQSGQSNKLITADNKTSVDVKNLTIFTDYWFAVKAVNVIGAGPESEEVHNTTFEDSKLK